MFSHFIARKQKQKVMHQGILDFHIEVLTAFDQHQVKYLIVGGHAVAVYGYVRTTSDLVLWIDQSPGNLKKLGEAIVSLGYTNDSCEKALDEIKQNKNIALFDDHNNKIDIIQLYSTRLSFEEAFKKRKDIPAGAITLYVIGFEDLIDTKIAAGRLKDLVDVKELKQLEALRLRSRKA
jgi:predicted nucleotidyltransferase